MRRILAVWARPGTRLGSLGATGAILPGCSSEAQALLLEVRAHGAGQGYTPADVTDLGNLWEWIERTGPREDQRGCPCVVPADAAGA